MIPVTISAKCIASYKEQKCNHKNAKNSNRGDMQNNTEVSNH